MTIARCRWVRPRLPLLAGGDWLGPDRRRIERHLIGCPSCRRHLEGLRVALDVLRTAPAPAPADSSSLWPALARQIRESRRPEPAWGSPRWTRPLIRLATAAVLLLSVFALGTRRDVRTQVNRMFAHLAQITRRPGLPVPVPRRVADQVAPPAVEPDEEEVSVADSTPSPRYRASDLGRVPSPDPQGAEPTR